MEINLAFEYFLFTLITTFATLQLVTSLKNRESVRILKDRNLTILLAVIFIFLSFLWFFSVRDRSIQTFMEGGQLSTIFGFGAFLSLVVTKILKNIYGHHKT